MCNVDRVIVIICLYINSDYILFVLVYLGVCIMFCYNYFVLMIDDENR